MKILCLHPWRACQLCYRFFCTFCACDIGLRCIVLDRETSAVTFEKQISNICRLIGESHNYVFVDGSVRCGPAKGMYLLRDGERGEHKERQKGRRKEECKISLVVLNRTADYRQRTLLLLVRESIMWRSQDSERPCMGYHR
jgi:prepilin-type processing-associated H-X9-DG protein